MRRVIGRAARSGCVWREPSAGTRSCPTERACARSGGCACCTQAASRRSMSALHPRRELEAPVLEAPAAYAADRPDPGAAVARQMSPACEFLAVALRTGSLVGLFTFHN